jgi:catechol 2,3-dioxygenase-like lactoylglutathione lyase family enzyme
MIGRIEKTVLDCPDPRTLAAFYAEVLGMRVNEDTAGDWQKDPTAPTARKLAAGPCRGAVRACRRNDRIRSTRSRNTSTSASTTWTTRSARFWRSAPPGCTTSTRTASGFTDPAGHPFCLVFG